MKFLNLKLSHISSEKIYFKFFASIGMNMQAFLKEMTTIHESLLQFIDNDDQTQENNLFSLLDKMQNQKDSNTFKKILSLIAGIADNYHRTSIFFGKIYEILKFLQKSIKQSLSNYEIFQIFKSNKKIILFLIKEKIITIYKKIVL